MKPHALAPLLLAAATVLTASTLRADETPSADACITERDDASAALEKNADDVDARRRLNAADDACLARAKSLLEEARADLAAGKDAEAKAKLERILTLAGDLDDDLRQRTVALKARASVALQDAPRGSPNPYEGKVAPAPTRLPPGSSAERGAPSPFHGMAAPVSTPDLPLQPPCGERRVLRMAVKQPDHDRRLDDQLAVVQRECLTSASHQLQVAMVYFSAENYTEAKKAALLAIEYAGDPDAKETRLARDLLQQIDRAQGK